VGLTKILTTGKSHPALPRSMKLRRPSRMKPVMGADFMISARAIRSLESVFVSAAVLMISNGCSGNKKSLREEGSVRPYLLCPSRPGQEDPGGFLSTSIPTGSGSSFDSRPVSRLHRPLPTRQEVLHFAMQQRFFGGLTREGQQEVQRQGRRQLSSEEMRLIPTHSSREAA
jgi:hypothetical protein